MEDRELLWRQYNQAVELYKFYLDLVVTARGVEALGTRIRTVLTMKLNR